jgi:hypothetical protein
MWRQARWRGIFTNIGCGCQKGRQRLAGTREGSTQARVRAPWIQNLSGRGANFKLRGERRLIRDRANVIHKRRKLLKRVISKRWGVAGGVLMVALAGPVVALALGIGAPRVGDVEAAFSVSLTGPVPLHTCVGPDGATYAEELFTWKGGISDLNTSGHVYPLTGTLVIKGTFTINSTTGEGVGVGGLSITGSSGLIAQGPFALPTQVIDSSADAVARGEINVPLFTGGSANGSRLIVNFEASLTHSTGVLKGFMGKTAGSPAVPDLAMEYNNLTCA